MIFASNAQTDGLTAAKSSLDCRQSLCKAWDVMALLACHSVSCKVKMLIFTYEICKAFGDSQM